MKTNPQLSFEMPSHGGARKGAGRKAKAEKRIPHRAREAANEKTPIHVTLKLMEQVPGLRTPSFIYRFAQIVANARRRGLLIQHYVIESNHIHLICEAASSEAMKRGMMSFTTSMIWALRRSFRYFGKVFVDRYHAHLLRTPTEMKNALRYVLFNHAKHTGKSFFADVYSSIFAFEDAQAFANIRIDFKPRWFDLIERELSEPRSWMQRVGWRRGR